MRVEQHHLRETLEHERDVIGQVAEWGEQHQRLRPLAEATAATDVALFYAQELIPQASLEVIQRRLRSERAEADLYMDDPRGADTRGKGYAERYFDKTLRTDEAVAQAFGSPAPKRSLRFAGEEVPDPLEVGGLPRGSDPVTYADLEAVLGAAWDERRWSRSLRALYTALVERRYGPKAGRP